jgi:hypothetical protein
MARWNGNRDEPGLNAQPRNEVAGPETKSSENNPMQSDFLARATRAKNDIKPLF